MAGILQKIGSALKNFGLKAPWQITGPVSSPEYLSHLPKAVDYRVFGPISYPGRAVVPHAEPENVYNIKYYTRDTRRQKLPGGTKKMVKSQIDVTQKTDGNPVATPGSPHQWGKPRSMLEEENGGYTL